MVEAFVATVVKAGDDGQVIRAAARFGLFVAAGELAAELGVVPWPAGRAREAANWAFKNWLEGRGGGGAAESRMALEQVRAFFEAHGDARFEALDGEDHRPVNNRAGWRSGEGAARLWFVPSEAWKAICAGMDPKAVAKALGERGMLVKAGDGWQSVRKIGGSNKRVYVLRGILEASDGGEETDGDASENADLDKGGDHGL